MRGGWADVDHKWLEDFIALARERSFSRAAEQRHVTQPQFSRRIRALELENKFLAGDELRPEDLDPAVAAKKGTRRSPRSTPR